MARWTGQNSLSRCTKRPVSRSRPIACKQPPTRSAVFSLCGRVLAREPVFAKPENLSPASSLPQGQRCLVCVGGCLHASQHSQSRKPIACKQPPTRSAVFSLCGRVLAREPAFAKLKTYRLQAASHKVSGVWFVWEGACTRASIRKAENLSPASSLPQGQRCLVCVGGCLHASQHSQS